MFFLASGAGVLLEELAVPPNMSCSLSSILLASPIARINSNCFCCCSCKIYNYESSPKGAKPSTSFIRSELFLAAISADSKFQADKKPRIADNDQIIHSEYRSFRIKHKIDNAMVWEKNLTT
jgi:hypothetical protein